MRQLCPRSHRISAVLLLAGLLTAAAPADEGMWLFNQPPRQQLRERHGFDATDAWMEHLQKSAVRFQTGGSGSFVSEDGLVMSNHHVGSDAIQKLSTPERDLIRQGFFARSRAEELPCPDLELNVLVGIEDVTARVNAAVPTSLAPEQAAPARRRVLAEIEQQSEQQTGLRSDVVTLFQGGAYHLYRYQRYTDVRLVFAPEEQAAFFGGDADNFEFPRYCLDVAFFRAYENGQPAKVKHFLRWSGAGATANELVFVAGHPGRTSRLLTVAELAAVRDRGVPAALERLNRMEVSLAAWASRSRENARQARDELFGVQNGRKARLGQLAGLQDPVFFGRLAESERAFRERLGTASGGVEALAAFDRITSAQQVLAAQAERQRFLEGAWGFHGELFDIARTLLRAGDERVKPAGERLREFRDSNRTSLELALFSPQPLHDGFEVVRLADSLSFLAVKLGATDPVVQSVLAGRSPRARAAELVAGTKVKDLAFRRQLYEGGAAAVRAAADPLIEVARLIDAEARQLRAVAEAQEEIRQQAHAAIARARFALYGADSYPDATFTLRLAYGIVKGYVEDGVEVPPFTDFAGLYQRSADQEARPPFDIPERWLKRKGRLDLATPFNFVSTADIIGGNSGSPVVNRAGELVGLIFDGNLASLVLDYAFDEVTARAVSVDSRAILAALRGVYDAKPLVEELTGRRRARE